MKLLAILTLAAAAAAAATGTKAAFRQRYAAVDMSPAVGGAGIVPRFFIDAPRLAVRDGGICNPNFHSCVDIGHPETCCANTNYCYVKPDNSPWCCPLGSLCDSNCPATAYQCPTTITVTATVSRTTSAASALLTTSLSTSSACCGRTCPSPSAFRCESQFGGGCCSYGQTCVSGGRCISTVSASVTSSATGGLKPADPQCTATTQHACDDTAAGCCDNLMHCTVVSGTAGCAAGNPTATGDVGYTTVPEGGSGGGGLSAGAKAGIGVGVALVGCALAGALAWFCFVRRRRRGTVTGTATMSERSGGGGRSRGTGAGRGGVSGVGSERPSRGVRALSDVTSGSRPNGPSRGATQDYFGPDAVAGPYTETDETGLSPGSGSGAGAGAGGGRAGTPGRGRGVPLQAHSPNDVVAPVEIGDSGGEKRGYGYGYGHGHGYGHSVTSVPEEGREGGPREMQTPGSEEETTQGRYELYGSEMASPVSVGAPPSSIVPTPSMMTPRSIASVSMFDRSPGPAPSDRERER
ncbi:uncharacterized protein CCOS01_06184 [Colletotrichum costaricense]|uniref:Uncharacterized protein n=1 Tax=Colletotrichum costaricense TaxID=1209916 RepID=A0AAI9Z357_9PEZI|nr:uncharacterized protein CCOS01_06184 [Colletotrichum costaricense]KAK1531081.1 hypothetical protein CCOS01_06184 [Colletotrichum costaricense]